MCHIDGLSELSPFTLQVRKGRNMLGPLESRIAPVVHLKRSNHDHEEVVRAACELKFS